MFATAVWYFKCSSPLGRLVWVIWLEPWGTFTPDGGSCCPMSHPEDSVFPCVSVQDVFFLLLLIFHDLMLASFKDQQRLLPARVLPTMGLWKSPVQSPVLSIPSGNHPLWHEREMGLLGRKRPGWAELLVAFEMAGGRNGDESGCNGECSAVWRAVCFAPVARFSWDVQPLGLIKKPLEIIVKKYVSFVIFSFFFFSFLFFLLSSNIAEPSAQGIAVKAARLHSTPCVDKHSQHVLFGSWFLMQSD